LANPSSILKLLTKETSITHFDLIQACKEFIKHSHLDPQLKALDVLHRQINSSSLSRQQHAQIYGRGVLYNPLFAESDSFYDVNFKEEVVSTEKYGKQAQVTIHSEKRSDMSIKRGYRSSRGFYLSIYPNVPGLFRIKLDTEDNGSSRFSDGPVFTSVREIEIDVRSTPYSCKCYATNCEVFDFTFRPSRSYIQVDHPRVSAQDVEQILAYAMRCFLRIKVLVGHPNTYRADELDRVIVGEDGSTQELADGSLLTDQGPQNHPQVFTRYNLLTECVAMMRHIKQEEKEQKQAGA
jgi:hypothetical protein